MNNETLAALTIIRECTHAMRGARDHNATWAAYLHEQAYRDEGRSVFATLKFASEVFKDGEIDPQRFAQDASIAIPPVYGTPTLRATASRAKRWTRTERNLRPPPPSVEAPGDIVQSDVRTFGRTARRVAIAEAP